MAILSVLSFCLCVGDGLLAPVTDNARKARACAIMRDKGWRQSGNSGMETKSADDRRERQRLDAELVTRTLRGGKDAFHDLTVRYYRPVCAFLLKRVAQADLVEDLAQETFLEAYRSLASLTRPEQFATWLFGIARNRCGKWLRRPRPVLFSAADPPDAVVPFVSDQEELEEQQQLLSRLESGLADLPEETRRLLDLKHRHGKTCAQIAGELGRPVGTIKSLLSRTYKTLRQRLCPEGECP